MSSSDIVRLASAIASVLGIIGGIVWWLLKRHLINLHRRIRMFEKKCETLEDQLQTSETENTRLENENRTLHQQVARLTEQADLLHRQVERDAVSVNVFRSEGSELRAERTLLQGQLASLMTQQTRQESETSRLLREREELEQQLHTRIEKYQDAVETDEQRIRQLEQTLSKQKALAGQEQELLTEERDEARAAAKQLNDQIDQVIKQDERVWERPVAGVAFQPLSLRNVPVIAILNLKGGVGKTTITANLAGLMSEQGKKVLVIDADYQRNLSMLLFSDTARKMLHLERRTLQHFLTGKSHALSTLLDAAGDVNGDGSCFAVTNSDTIRRQPTDQPSLGESSLEDAEMRLLGEWMFRPDGPDVRLFLRQALHDLNLKGDGFSYVLIDCPPRLSTACINAVAASDFILVPVLTDATSARSVPNLLRTLNRLRSEAIFPHLHVLGVVANGVKYYADRPIAQQAETWSELPAP